MSASKYKQCTLCPRECKADRTKTVGFCGMGGRITAAKAMIHNSEEPCISGSRGSGAIFFSGCVLKCLFCQNSKISHEKFGIEITEQHLSKIMLELQSLDVHNINLVSGTQFYPSIIRALDIARDKLSIPVVWNTGGYEKVEAIRELSLYCSVFLQDLKFVSTVVSDKYASCKDYYYHAMKATEQMLNSIGNVELDDNGIVKKGVIIRHLVIPSNRMDSIELLKSIKANFGCEGFLLSLRCTALRYPRPMMRSNSPRTPSRSLTIS